MSILAWTVWHAGQDFAIVKAMNRSTRALAPMQHTYHAPHGALHFWEYNPSGAPTVVVIHGYRGTHHGLERIIAELPSVRFIVPDLPGFGVSAPLTASHSIDAYTAVVADFMTAQHLEGHTVLGHSMGSIVAAELAKTHPELMRSLILINPIASHPLKGTSGLIVRPSIAYHWLGGKVLPARLGRKLLDNKAFLLLGSVLMAKTRQSDLRRWIHHQHTTHMAEYDNPRMLYEAYLASLSGTVYDRAPHIKVPTLLIAGERDELAPPAAQRRLVHELADAELVMIDHVGHLIHYEKPAEAAEAIAQFLNQSAARKY